MSSVSMTALPSFVQLMATLGLDNRPSDHISESRSPSHSRSNSNSSTASSVIQFSNLSTPREAHRTQSIPSLRDTDSDRRSGSTRNRRYSPYSFGGTDSRRESLPSLVGSITESGSTTRSISPASPRLSRRRVPAQLNNIPSHTDDLPASMLDQEADTPISVFARRRTPQGSPISPVFPRHSRSNPRLRSASTSSVTATISLPTIPSIQQHSPPLSDAGSDRTSSSRNSPFAFDASMALPDIAEVDYHARPHNHTGIRLSAPIA